MDSTTSPYARFIPREEVGGFAAWQPNAIGPAGAAKAGAAQATRASVPAAALQDARQAGYQDGYRDGLVALESFKQSIAQQLAAQIVPLVAGFDAAFTDLESQIADAVARTATSLALQVVRSELKVRPELVAQVAAEAVNAVLLSARHIRVFAHPEDLMLIEAGAAETLAARQARLIADASLTRGGCRVESDLGRVDARIQTRWQRCAEQLGAPIAFDAALDAPAPEGLGTAPAPAEDA